VSKKKGLGRGLSALFGDEQPKDKPQEIKKQNYIFNQCIPREFLVFKIKKLSFIKYSHKVCEKVKLML